MTPSQKLRSIADSTGLDGIADAIREIAEEIEHNNAPAVPQGYPVLPDYVEDAIERCKSMPGHPPAWVDMMRSMRKALGAATPAPAPAQEPTTFTSPVRTPAPPFATFDEAGKGCDDRVQDFYHAHSKEVETRAFNRGYDAAKPAQDAGLTDEVVNDAAKVLAERFDYPWEHMPEEGRKNMRVQARAVVEAALRAKGGK